MKKLLATAAVIVCGIATAGAAPRDRSVPPPAVEDGKAVSCVRLTDIRNTSVHGDSTIDFHMNNGRVLRNTLPMGCPGLGFEERFLHKTSLGELCSVDIITVLHSPDLTPGPSCGLGKFQPVKLVKG